MSELRDRLRYLRVSLLNYCNLSCFYCKPSARGHQQSGVADASMVTEAIAALHSFGVRKVRFTGGEPTLHTQLTTLIKSTNALSPDMSCAVTTNGMLLERLAPSLAEAGLDSINISLDSLQSDKFTDITGVEGLESVVAGIRACKALIPEVKLNCVMMKCVNDDEATEMVVFADSLGVDIRFIEYMPSRGNLTRRDLYIAGDVVKRSIPFALTPLPGSREAAARYYVANNLRIRVGFINAVSHPFCAHCDRIRMTSAGNLYGCLFSGHKVKLSTVLAKGRERLQESLQELIDNKRSPGCPSAGNMGENLPSFVDIGG